MLTELYVFVLIQNVILSFKGSNRLKINTFLGPDIKIKLSGGGGEVSRSVPMDISKDEDPFWS